LENSKAFKKQTLGSEINLSLFWKNSKIFKKEIKKISCKTSEQFNQNSFILKKLLC